VCPSYWFAEAYTTPPRTAYKYQYSVPIALHGSDVAAYFGPPTSNQSPDFVSAIQQIWGNFITHDNPSISSNIANGVSTSNDSTSPVSDWPPYNFYNGGPYQINLNETGGMPYNYTLTYTGVNTTAYGGQGQRNSFELVNAYTWEGGRGQRCDFWRAASAIVPE